MPGHLIHLKRTVAVFGSSGSKPDRLKLSLLNIFLMSDAGNCTLANLWKTGRTGTLSPLETLKAYCYAKVYREQGETEHGLWTKVAEKVTKVGGGHPERCSVRKLVNKIDEDPD